jgi:tetratricopeptide (TPR) repeat protein
MFPEPAAEREARVPPPSKPAARAAARPAPEPEDEAEPPATLTVQDGGGAGEDFVDLRAELERELTDESESETETPRSEAALVNGLLSELQKGVREKVDAKDYETHYNLGIAYKEMDLFDEAVEEFSLASADSRWVLECADLLGQCHLAKGQPQLAVASLRAGLEVAGHPPEAYRSLRYGLALAYEALGDDAAALEQLERLTGEDPRFRDVQSRLQALRARQPRRARVEPVAAPPPPAPAPAAARPRKPRKISFI